MGNGIVIAIILLIFFIGLKSTVKHFKGQGACCGGGSSVKAKRKKLMGTVVTELTLTIDGMHCENCKNRIESKINELEGVSCKVYLRKKSATIVSTHELNPEDIREIIQKLGYVCQNAI